MAVNAKPIILYENLFEDGTITATGTDSDPAYNVLNLIDWRPYTFWKAATYGYNYLYTWDLGTARAANCLVLAGHNLYTAGGYFAVYHSPDNGVSGWVTSLVNTYATSDNPLLVTFTSASDAYWRIKLYTASVIPYVAIVCLGTYLQFNKYPDAGFDPYSETPQQVEGVSETGNLLGVLNTYTKRNVSAQFSNLDPTWVTRYKTFWTNHMKLGYPFFWAWDVTNHSTEVHLVKKPAGASLSLPYDPVTQSLSFEAEGIV